MKILANEPLTCVAGEDVYEVLQSYQADELHAFISQHAADQYAGLMYLSDWSKVLNDIDTFLNEITHTKRNLFVFVSKTTFMNLATAEDVTARSELVNALQFTENLLKQVYGKEFYQSAEHLLILTASGDDEVAALALSCLHNLTSFPDNHHSVVLEDRHITMLHKNASYFWPLFQIVEACLGRYTTAQQLLSETFVVPTTSADLVTIDSDAVILPMLYPASPLAALFSDTASSTDTVMEITINDNDYSIALQTAETAVSPNDLRFLALWKLRSRRWLFDYNGRKLLVACLLRCCAILLSSYPDSNFLSTFFHDKVDLIKDLIHLISTGPLTLPEPGQVWKKDDFLEIRILATWCMSSLVDSKDQTATPMVLHYPWILYELGVQRGQYMGLIPCLIRCCVATLAPLRRDLAERSKMGSKELSSMEFDVLCWIERVLIMIFYVSSLNFVLPALLENGLISSMLSLAAADEEALYPQLMWIDNLAFTIMEVAMGLSPVSFVNFREHLGPEILIGRMNKLMKVSLDRQVKVSCSQISLLQQFISGISCYLQENQMEGDDGGASQHFRDPLLMEAFSLLFDNAERFHGSVPAAGIALLSEMMSRDAAPPSVVTYVISSGLAKKALDVVVKDLSITNNDFPLAVVSFISSLSLTADGVELVIATAALQNILRMFANIMNYLPYSRNLVGEHTGGLNASLEELLRHYPAYRTVVIGSLMDAMQKAIAMANNKSTDTDSESRTKHFQREVYPYMIAANSMLCILEQLFVRKENAIHFLTEYGVQTLVELNQLAMGNSEVFLVTASCAMEGSSTANGYTPLLTTLGRVVHQLSAHDRKLILTQTIDIMSTAQERFVNTCTNFQRDILGLSQAIEIDFGAILGAVVDAPLSILLQGDTVVLKQYSNVFQSLSILLFLYEMFYECQGGRNGKTVDGKEVFAVLKEKNFHTTMQSALETIYSSTQKGLAKYKVDYRIPGLSKDPWIVQPNYVLLLVGDNATARDSSLETSKRVGRLSRGSVLVATERLLVGSVVKYKTVHGWVNQFRSHHGVEQQVMIIDVVEKTEEEKQKFLEEKSSQKDIETVARRFEMDKYARVTARRGGAFIIYCHHIVVKTYLMGAFSRIFHKVDSLTGVKDLTWHTRTKDFVDMYLISSFTSFFNGLLSTYVVHDSSFDLESFLTTLEESSLEGEESLEEWGRSFSMQTKLHFVWDIDAVLVCTRVIDLVRSLLRDPRKQRLSDISAIIVKVFFEDRKLLTLLLGATSCLFHVCMEESSQQTSSAEAPTRLKEVKLVALSSLETVIDLWKDVLSAFVVSAQENVTEDFGCGELSRRRVCLMIAHYLLPLWLHQGFVTLPASVARNALDLASVLVKGLHDLGQHSEPRASKSSTLSTRPTTTASGGMAASYAALRRASAARVAAPAPTPFQPNEATVQQVVEMGFERNSIINAMRMLRTNNAAQLVSFLIENPFLHAFPGSHGDEAGDNPTLEAVVDTAVGSSDEDGIGRMLVGDGVQAASSASSAVDNREKIFSVVYKETKNEKALSTKVFQTMISMAINVVMASLQHGKAALDDVVDVDMLTVDSAIDEDMFVILLLNISLKFLESFQFGEVTVRFLQLTWLYRAGNEVFTAHVNNEVLQNKLRGILHAIVVNLTCKIANWNQRRSHTNCAELLLIVAQRDPRLSPFHALILEQLHKSADSMVTNTESLDEKQLDQRVAWSVPAVLLLDLFQQNVVVDCEALRATIRDDIENLHKYNPGRMKDLKAIQASTEDLLNEEVVAFVHGDLNNHNIKPLLLSSFSDANKMKMTDIALTMLKVSGKSKKLSELTRASIQLITHALSSTAVREHFARSRGVERLLECSVSYEGLSSLAFSALQRYLEDDSYLKQAIKVVLKLVHDRLKKTERVVFLKSLIEAACPMLYRDQSLFLEDIQELFTIDFTPDGTLLKLKDPAVESKPVEVEQKNTEEPKTEEQATGSAAKRQKISETHSVPTKIVETPLKRKGDHHSNSALRNSRLSAVQEIVDLIVTKIVQSWVFIAKERGLIPSTDDMETEDTRSFSLPDNFMVLSDLIASFPAVAVSLQKKHVLHPAVLEFMRGKQGYDDQEEVNFAVFVIHCFLLHNSEHDRDIADQAEPENATSHSFGALVQDSCRYLLASIISRPNDGGRASVMHEIAGLISTCGSTNDLRPIPKLVELLTVLINPPAKWLQRELFMLPGRDICSSLINSDIYTRLTHLFSVIQLKSPLAEKALSSLSNVIDIILRKQQSSKDAKKTGPNQPPANEAMPFALMTTAEMAASAMAVEDPAPLPIHSEHSEGQHAAADFEDFHEQLLFPPSQALLPTAPLAGEDDDSEGEDLQQEEEDEHDGIASVNLSLDEQEGDEDDDSEDDDDDDEIGEHEEIVLDDDAAELIMDEIGQHDGHGHHHGHGHQSEGSSQSGHSDDDEDSDDDNDGDDHHHHHRHDHEEEGDHEDGMMDDDEGDDEDINSEDASEHDDDGQQAAHDQHGDQEDDYGDEIIEDDAVDGYDQVNHGDDEDEAAMDILDDDDEDAGENFEMVEHMFEGEEDDDDHHTPEMEGQEDGMEGGGDDPNATGRAFVFDPDLGMIPVNQAGRSRRGGRDSARGGHTRRIRMDFGGEEGGGGIPDFLASDYDPSDGIGFRLHAHDGGGIGAAVGAFEGRLTFSEFQDLFPGAMSGSNMSRMMSSHSRAIRAGSSLTIPAVSPHPLLMSADNRRGRVPPLWPSSSAHHGGMVLSTSQGAHYTLDIQSRNRSQLSNKRRALGPLLSDRRWGTDISDLELPSSRLSILTMAVEQYLENVLPAGEAKVFKSSSRDKYNPFGFPFRRGWESKEDEGELQESKEEVGDPHRISLRSTPFRGLWGAAPSNRSSHPEESKDEGELRETKEDDEPIPAAPTTSSSSAAAPFTTPAQATSSSSSAGFEASRLAFDSIFQAFAASSHPPSNSHAPSVSNMSNVELVQQLQTLADTEADGGDDHDENGDDDNDVEMDFDEEGDEDGEDDIAHDDDDDGEDERDDHGDDGNNDNDNEDEMEVDLQVNEEFVGLLNQPEPAEEVNENLLFIESLPDDLRRDVLIAAEQSFLDSLPAHIQAEAMDLREGQAIQFQMDTFEPPAPQIAVAPVPATNDPQEANNMFAAAIQRIAQQHAQQTATAAPAAAVSNAARRSASSRAPQHQLAPVAGTEDSNRIIYPGWYLPLSGDSFDLSATPLKPAFLLKLLEWNVCGKLDRSPSRFRMFQLVFGDKSNRHCMSRALISLMTGNSLEVGIEGFDDFKGLLREQQSELVIYRRVLLTWTHLFRKSNHLLWFELTTANEQKRSLFHEILSCLGRIKLPTVEFEQSLTFIERICKVWTRLTVDQVNRLIASFATVATSSEENENATAVVAASGAQNDQEQAERGEEGEENVSDEEETAGARGRRPPSARTSTAASSSIFGTTEENFRNRVAQLMGRPPSAASTAARHVLNRHRQKNNAATDASIKKEKMHFPVLEGIDSRGMISAYIQHDCSSNARKIYNKIFRALSLYDGNWKLFLTGLAEQAEDLVCLTTLEFQSLLTVLQTAVDQQEDVIHVLSRPELSSPKVLKEAQLLHALKLMTMLRSRSSAVAASEALVVAEYLRSINSGDLWDILCECLDKVREIEENQLDREARRSRNRRSASFSYASASAAASTTDLASVTAAAAAEGGPGRPLSALTMRFVPLIECFLSIFSRTMFVAPSQQQAHSTSPVQQAVVGEDGSSSLPVTQSLSPTQQASSSSTAAAAAATTAGEIVSRSHSHLLPGGRFRQSPSYLAMQLEVSEDKAAAQLLRFAENHQDLLNKVLRNNIHLLESSFSPLVNVPKLRALLHFDIKRAYFRAKIKRLRQTNSARMYGGIRLTVRRARVFEESFQALRHKTADEMRRRLSISFHNEEGMDAGGLTREWYHLLAREIFNPNYALFLSTTGDGVTFQPNAQSWVNPDHLSYFKFVGRIIGKALCDGALLDAHFTRPFYKHILGLPVSLQDLEAIEPAYYKSLLQLLETPLDMLGLDLTFAAETNDFGKIEIVDLIPDGQKIPVTDETKHEYVKLLAHHRMTAAIRKQIESFLDGFHELVPAELISIFDAQEVELLISGLPEIDVDDMRGHCDYHGYRPADLLISWFWAALKTFSTEEKALFLQFVTGTSKVPLDGFKALQGADGIKRLNIHRAYGGDVALPTAHTCFNQLDLPEYSSEDILREKLLLAIREGSEGFGFA